jgi:putative peptidoglycan lipid II flippase
VATSTLLVMAASALSALLGFGREIITAHYYGTRSEMDAFINATTVPAIVIEIFSGALVVALVPTFSEYMRQGRSDDVRRLGSTIINAPVFVPVVAHGFPPAEQSLVVEMVRWTMPAIVATSLGGVCAALLNANHQFVASSLIWVAANVVTIVFVVTLHRELGIFALVLGSVLGLFAQLLVQVPSILWHRLYRFELDLRHPGLATIWARLVPVALGSGAAQINLTFDKYFASVLTPGSTSGLGYTTKLAFLPLVIAATAISTVIFPLIAAQAASEDWTGIRRSISLALRMVGFIVIPCAAGLCALAYPIVQTLFERGAFGPASTALCASLIPFACVPLVMISYNTVLTRACYACKGVGLVAASSIVTVAINIALSALWIKTLGASGLLLANGAAGLILIALQIALLRRLIGGFEWLPLVSSFVRVSLAALAMAVTLRLYSFAYAPQASFAMHALYLAGLLALGGVVYLGVARVLGVEELTIVATTLMKKFSRGAVIPSETAVGPIG